MTEEVYESLISRPERFFKLYREIKFFFVTLNVYGFAFSSFISLAVYSFITSSPICHLLYQMSFGLESSKCPLYTSYTLHCCLLSGISYLFCMSTFRVLPLSLSVHSLVSKPFSYLSISLDLSLLQSVYGLGFLLLFQA